MSDKIILIIKKQFINYKYIILIFIFDMNYDFNNKNINNYL